MNLCVLSSNGMVQKKHILDPSPHLFKAKPNGSSPIMTLHMNEDICRNWHFVFSFIIVLVHAHYINAQMSNHST